MDSIRLKDSQIILAASQVIGIIAIFIDLQNSYKNSCSERPSEWPKSSMSAKL